MPTPRVLTIDDDETQLTLIKKTLEKKDYFVYTAKTGEEGIAIAIETVPQLILLDVNLPGMNGKEVCKRLKANLKTEKIPIIFLTSKDSPREIVEQYDVGGEIHLAKPIKPRELIKEIQNTLDYCSN